MDWRRKITNFDTCRAGAASHVLMVLPPAKQELQKRVRYIPSRSVVDTGVVAQ